MKNSKSLMITVGMLLITSITVGFCILKASGEKKIKKKDEHINDKKQVECNKTVSNLDLEVQLSTSEGRDKYYHDILESIFLKENITSLEELFEEFIKAVVVKIMDNEEALLELPKNEQEFINLVGKLGLSELAEKIL